MQLVTESNVTGTLFFKDQFAYRMTFRTFFDGKSNFGIVACATGATLFHSSHADSFVQLSRGIQFWMARVASSNLDVSFMTEMCRAGFFNFISSFLHWMAGHAFINAKSILAVVAGTARFPLPHGSHGETLVGTSGKDGRVACAAVS